MPAPTDIYDLLQGQTQPGIIMTSLLELLVIKHTVKQVRKTNQNCKFSNRIEVLQKSEAICQISDGVTFGRVVFRNGYSCTMWTGHHEGHLFLQMDPVIWHELTLCSLFTSGTQMCCHYFINHHLTGTLNQQHHKDGSWIPHREPRILYF